MSGIVFHGANLHLQLRAQQAVRRAVKSGTIEPSPCEVCGEPGVGHHEDYAEPLEVVWLCRLHHAWRHHGSTVDELKAELAA